MTFDILDLVSNIHEIAKRSSQTTPGEVRRGGGGLPIANERAATPRGQCP